MKIKDYIYLARIDHWFKNVFMIPGIIFGITKLNYIDNNLFYIIPLAIFSTCLAASANYVINEYLDADYDKYHPIKSNRPLVSLEYNKFIILLMYLSFMISSLMISKFISDNFFYVTILLIIMGVIYNVKPLRTKDIVYFDVLSESINNPIRLALGWFCVTDVNEIPLSLIIAYWIYF